MTIRKALSWAWPLAVFPVSISSRAALIPLMLTAASMVAFPSSASAAVSRATIGVPNGPSLISGGIVNTDPLPPPDNDFPRPTEPRLGVWQKTGSSTSLEVSFTCGVGVNTLYRRQTGDAYGPGLYLEPKCPDGKPSGRIEPTDLEPGTQYCYKIVAVNKGQSKQKEVCATTQYQRVAFLNELITPGESHRVLGAFDWLQTNPVEEKTPSYHAQPNQPYLYYMNVLLETESTVSELRQLGVHVQETPVFQQELSQWRDSLALATSDGEFSGRWYFAVVPGAVYNALRSVSIESITAGDEAPIRAIVFRRIPAPSARASSWDAHQLSYRYLGEQAFEFNGEVASGVDCQIVNGQEICTTRILGWLARKVLEYVDEGLTYIVDRVREGIGRFNRVIKGEVSLTLQFRLHDTDPLFSRRGAPMKSGWSGQELMLKGINVHVRQGLAAFIDKTDAQGRVTLEVAKNANTEICLQAENRYLKLTEFLGRTVVCLRDIGKLSTDTSATILVKHEYFNVLAQMTDAAEYLKTVAGHDMDKITVLVGDLADNVALAGRAFTPCMGRRPNLVTGTLSDALLAIFPLLGSQSVLAEFMLSVDIVLPPDDDLSRGVGVHEYGHAVMCDLITAQGVAGEASFQSIWTQVILGSANQSGDNEASYIAEAFADFITSQVIGGTNYFMPSDSFSSESINYCQAGSANCVDENFDQGQGTGSTRFRAQVRRVEGILHDVFDGHLVSNKPNDGSHWLVATPGGVPRNAVSPDSDRRDECVALRGTELDALFSNWVSRGPYVDESTFFGALVDTMRAQGNSNDAICHLFSLHSDSGSCPDSVASQVPRFVNVVPSCLRPGTMSPLSAVSAVRP